MTAETKSKKAEARERQEALNDIIAVMDTHAGRRMIWRLLTHARVFTTTFNGQSNATIFREGQRNEGVWLMTQVLEANPELYLLMQKEHYIIAKPDKPADKENSND